MDDEEGECYICFQAYSEHADQVPRVLGCGHTLCHHCVDRLAQESAPIKHRRIRCPECNSVTVLASPCSLPKNIELLRLLHKRPSPTQDELLSVDEKLDGFFVPEEVSPFWPSQASVHVESRSSDKRLIIGRLLGPGGKDGHAVSLLFLCNGSLSKSRRKEVGFVMRLASLCHWACGVLGILRSGTQLYLVNSIPNSGGVADYLLGEEQSKAQLISMAVNMCESLLEVHCQGMAFGLLSPAMFALSTQFAPRLLVHWNAALHLRSVMHRLISVAPDEPLDVWNYCSPEMLLALHSSGPRSPDDKADVWSFATFIHHLLFSSPSSPLSPLSFMQARQRLECGQLLESSMDAATLGPLEDLQDFLRQCLVLDPAQRPTMSQVWQQLRCCQSVNSPISDSPRFQTRVSFCFGLQREGDAPAPHQAQQTRSVSFDPHQLQLLATLDGHGDCITSLAVFGDKLISSSFDKSVRIWSVQDGSLLWCWEGHHSHRVLALVVDTNNRLCFTGDYGGAILAWKLDEPFETQPHTKWQEHEDWRFSGVSALAVASDGILYSGSGDKTIKAWSTPKEHKLIATLKGHRGLVSALAVSGSLLYSGSWDGCVGVWLCGDHAPLAMVDCGAGAVRALAVSSSANVDGVVSAHDNGCIQIWRDGASHGVLRVHDGVVSCVAVSKEHVVTGSWDKCLKVWRASDVVEESKGEREAIKIIRVEDAVLSMVLAKGCDLYAGIVATINVYKSC